MNSTTPHTTALTAPTSRSRTLLLGTMLTLAVVAVGCKRETSAPPADAQAAAAEATAPAAAPVVADAAVPPAAPAIDAPATMPGTDAVVVEERATPIGANAGFDAEAFSGRYVAGDIALEVTADGLFALNRAGTAIDGSWTVMPGGKMVLLDPDSKAESDQRIQVVSNDELQIVGGTTLKRHAEAQ